MGPAMGAGTQIWVPPWDPVPKFGFRHGSRGPNLGPAIGAGPKIWVPPWEPVPKFGVRHGSRDPNLCPARGAGTQIWVPPWEPGPKFGFRPYIWVPTRGTKIILAKWEEAEIFKLPGAPPSESIVSRFRPLVGTVPPAALWDPPPSPPEAPASGHPAVLCRRRTASSPSISHSIVSRFPPHVGTPLRLSLKEGLPLSPIYIYARDR